MPSAAATIDVEALLAPIPGDNPAGESLQYAGLYDEIREARRADDDLNQGDWKRENKVADWPQVIELAVDALTTKTKDIQVVAWLTEALLMEKGLPGLRDALKVMNGLQKAFWDQLFPEAEDGDLEARANSLAWMERQAAIALATVPLTKASGQNYNYREYEESRAYDVPETEGDPDRLALLRQKAESEGKTSGEAFRKAKAATRRPFYEDLLVQIGEVRAELKTLNSVIDEKYGRQAPALLALGKGVDGIHGFAERTVKEKRISEPDQAAPGEAPADAPAAASGQAAGYGPVIAVGAIRSRQDALRTLGQVADFFRQTEPHSPVSYLVQRAITWGQMPFESWLAEVVKDSGTLESIRETLGIRPE